MGGDAASPENLIVLCPTCHLAIDSSPTLISMDLLRRIKENWVKKGVPGRGNVLASFDHRANRRPDDRELSRWLSALHRYNSFDDIITTIAKDLASLPSEQDFLVRFLKPLVESLGFRGATILHHTGRSEHGKDMVFYDYDRLGGLTYYGVVATKAKIHANSARTSDPGHYRKILDQIEKCYLLPFEDMNLKGEFFLDKVIVACAETISDEALRAFRMWEERERRHLIYWSGPDIAGLLINRRMIEDTTA